MSEDQLNDLIVKTISKAYGKYPDDIKAIMEHIYKNTPVPRYEEPPAYYQGGRRKKRKSKSKRTRKRH